MQNSPIYFKPNDEVQWKWLGRTVRGVIKEVYYKPVVKTIKSKKIKRNASESNPAYLVQSEAGNYALKLQTELRKVDIINIKQKLPSMFRK